MARNTINRVACYDPRNETGGISREEGKEETTLPHMPPDANKLDTRRSVKVNYDGGASATCFPRALSKTERTAGRLGERIGRSDGALNRKHFLTWNTLWSTRETRNEYYIYYNKYYIQYIYNNNNAMYNSKYYIDIYLNGNIIINIVFNILYIYI